MTKYICKACGHDYSGAMPHPGTISPPTLPGDKAEFLRLVKGAVGNPQYKYQCPVARVESVILAIEDKPPPTPLPSFLPKPRVWEGKVRF